MPTVPELVLSTAQLAISLAADEIARKGDLEQAQLAIDTADALMPLVGRLLPPEHLRQYRRALSELQLAYAEASAPAVRAAAAGQEPEPPRTRNRRSRRRRVRPSGHREETYEQRRDRGVRRVGVLLVPRRRRGGGGGHAVRPDLGPLRDRRRGRQAGGVHAPPRPHPQPAAARDPLPRQPVGDEGAGRAPRDRPVRLGQPVQGSAAGHVRGLRPVRRSHQRPRRHVLRRAGDDARLGRRPVLPRAAADPARDRPRAGPRHPRRRHRGGDPGPALLDPVGEPLVSARWGGA